MMTFILLFALALLLAMLFPVARHKIRLGRMAMAINIAEGTHEKALSRLSDAAIGRYLLVKRGSDNDHFAVNGANDMPYATTVDEAAAAEELVALALLGKGPTKLMVASEALATVGVPVYTAASGKIQDTPAGAGTYWQVGILQSVSGADGDLVEVQCCIPIKLVVS